MSLASGAHPTATFPCNHLAQPGVSGKTPGDRSSHEAKWSAPQTGSPVDELRLAIHDEDWKSHFSAGLTKSEVQASWAANAERCATLQCIASLKKATRVLEVGGFCGVAALALAEKLPADGQVVSLEYDQFLADFGQRHIMKSTSGSKISTLVGLAQESLEELAKKSEKW
jgi:predicted O-methyltransferase YrrM